MPNNINPRIWHGMLNNFVIKGYFEVTFFVLQKDTQNA